MILKIENKQTAYILQILQPLVLLGIIKMEEIEGIVDSFRNGDILSFEIGDLDTEKLLSIETYMNELNVAHQLVA